MKNKTNSPTGKRLSKNNLNNLGRVIKEMASGNVVKLILIGILIILSSVTMVIGIGYVQDLIDIYIPSITEAQGDSAALAAANASFKVFMIKWCAIFLLSVITSFIQSFMLITISQKTMRNIKEKTFNHMQSLPISYFDQNKYGDIMSRYTNDIDTLDNFITQTVPNFASSIVTLIVLLIFMFINSWILTLSVLLLMSTIMIGSKGIMKKSAKHFMGRQKLVGLTNGYVEEMMQGARVVQVFNHQEKSVEEFNKINEDFRVEDMKANTYGNIMMPMMANFVRIQFVVLSILGSILTIYTPYTIGALVVFLTYANNFSNPIGRMSQQINSIAQAAAGSSRIYELVDSEKEEDKGKVTLVNYWMENGEYIETIDNNHAWAWKHPHDDGSVTYTPLKGDITLENVDFSYEEGKQVLYDINIYAKPGQKVALVGQTGAGKTTITNLINRFYDIEDGKIRYDGININKIKKEDLRRSLGLVLQDTNLFTGTIKDNIKYGKRDATDEEVVAAAKIANADGFIRMMADGYDTVLTQAGESLSHGQRQLIAIARAAIADCPVLILDEATASIDTRTEAIVQEGMDKLMEGRTVFVIAHRLSTVQKSDVIMVMDHGRIIERGNHKELIEKKGVYYQLYTGAFELE